MSVNKVILVGNVGKDPDIRYFEKEENKRYTVANFTLATTERMYNSQSNQTTERTEWHNIVAWRGLATLAEKYVKKGSQLYVEGRLQTRNWEKDGIVRYTTEIIADNIQLLGSKRASNHAATAETPMANDISTMPQLETDDSDDLPF